MVTLPRGSPFGVRPGNGVRQRAPVEDEIAHTSVQNGLSMESRWGLSEGQSGKRSHL